MENDFRKAVMDAYAKARLEPGNVAPLPEWDQLDIDMRCALITVFAEGMKHTLDKFARKAA